MTLTLGGERTSGCGEDTSASPTEFQASECPGYKKNANVTSYLNISHSGYEHRQRPITKVLRQC